jgi:NADPH:quinone reductase-like Zn-dependent oxidoreductase
MWAARIHTFGSADAIVVESAPEPVLRERDLLIRVAASGVNPIEWKIRSGGMAKALGRPLPATLGWECAGVVEAVGSAVTSFRPGDAIYAYPEFTRDGTHAEFVAVDEAQAALKPRSLSFNEAAAVPMTAQAAWTLIEAANLKAGERILVHGGAGAVGRWLVQFAKRKGAEVLATASGEGRDVVRSLGADRAIDHRVERFEDTVGGSINVVADLVGGETLMRSFALLGKGARLLSTVQPPPADRTEAVGAMAGFVFTQPRGSVLAEIGTLIDAGAVKGLPVALVLPLAEARRAHELAEVGKAGGKVVLTTDHLR